MAVLEHLEPKSVFHFFEEISKIPRGSGNIQAISDWLVNFAKERDLEVHRDALQNVIIIKEATPGYEKAEPIIIQGHMDMVCEKAPGCQKDMAAEGLDLAVDGDIIYAKETTLGGDDGIAVAMALAILDADDLYHPRVEAVITVDEEIGLIGAAGIDVSPLKGHRMMNLDSEEEGIFTVSCAGGNDSHCVLPVTRAAYPGTVLTIQVGGLIGGHSGAEIDKGRGNANLIMGRVLYEASRKADQRLVRVDGGQKDNVIPRASVAVIVSADAEAVKRSCQATEAALKNEYQATDPDVCVTAVEGTAEWAPMDADSTQRAITMLHCIPNGIQSMSAEMPGLVQTSLNLGALMTNETEVEGGSCVRSSIGSEKDMITDRLICLMDQLGGNVEVHGDYPGWAYAKESPLRDLLSQVFAAQYGHDPKIEAIHAGLECGMFVDKIPGLDCISLGPDLEEIHTCREKLHIASVQRVWKMLVEALRCMK